MSTLPNQKIPKSQKNRAWGIANIDHRISEASFSSKYKTELKALYEAYNGIMNPASYSYVTNPYNATGKKWNFPARLKNFNILKPVVDLLMGEKSKRFMQFQVIVNNPDVVSKREEKLAADMNSSLEQLFINELNNLGLQTNVPSKEMPPPEEQAAKLRGTYTDQRALLGEEAIEAIRYYNDLPEAHQKGFFDWLIAGEVYSYKSVRFDDIVYDIVSPMSIDYERSPGIEFVEDAGWVVRREQMSPSEVLDKFHDLIKEDAPDAVEWLDSNQNRQTSGGFFFGARGGSDSNTFHTNNRLVEVHHVVWKSMRKVGVLTYVDEVGQIQKTWVDEEYMTDRDMEHVEWTWISEWWEGYKIDQKFYLGIKPLEVQRTEMSNPSRCKGPYNGRVYSARHTENISVLRLGMAYQILYNIYHYRFELTMAKNKDKIALIDINAMPKRHGWDEERFMYTADALGFAFVDSSDKAKLNGFNQYQVLDMSLGQYAAATLNVLASIKQEWEELVGFNAPRKGQTAASDGLGKMQQSIFQSSVITEELFRKYEKWQEVEMQGLLDVSKFAWKDGKKGMYVTSDKRRAILDLEPEQYQEADYGIRVVNSGEENEKLELLKQAAMSFAQNGSTPSAVAEVLSAKSFTKIKQYLEKADEMQAKMAQQQQEAEQAHEQNLVAMEKGKQDAQNTWQSTENELDREHDLIIKHIDVESKFLENSQAGPDAPEDKSGELAVKHQELLAKIQKDREDVQLRQRELKLKETSENNKLTLGREQIQSSEKIARMKPAPSSSTKK